MIQKWITLCLIFLTMSACRFSQFNPFINIDEYPAPEISADNSWFEEHGCFESTSCLPEDLLKPNYQINNILPVPDILGGFTPKFPLALLQNISFYGDPEVPAVYTEGCMATFGVRYLAVEQDQIVLVDSVEDLQRLAAPIESEDEALSYAVAATGLTPLYDLESHPEYIRYAKPLAESHVVFDGEKYLVTLFDTFLCGCGPHIVESVEVAIQPDGSLQLGEKVNAFSDPETEGLCID